jgi:hypothetical protein
VTAPYREAALVVPRTRLGLTWRAPDASERRWTIALCVPGLLSGVLLRVLGELVGVLAVVAVLTVAWWLAGMRLVRVPVTIPADRSFDAWRDHVDALREHRRRAGDSTCGCERCGHGRLECDACDDCGRTGLLP